MTTARYSDSIEMGFPGSEGVAMTAADNKNGDITLVGRRGYLPQHWAESEHVPARQA